MNAAREDRGESCVVIAIRATVGGILLLLLGCSMEVQHSERIVITWQNPKKARINVDNTYDQPLDYRIDGRPQAPVSPGKHAMVELRPGRHAFSFWVKGRKLEGMKLRLKAGELTLFNPGGYGSYQHDVQHFTKTPSRYGAVGNKHHHLAGKSVYELGLCVDLGARRPETVATQSSLMTWDAWIGDVWRDGERRGSRKRVKGLTSPPTGAGRASRAGRAGPGVAAASDVVPRPSGAASASLPAARTAARTSRGSAGSAPATLGVRAARVDDVARVGHCVQVWRVDSGYEGRRCKLRIRHARAGETGAFELVVWIDRNGDGRPDKCVARSPWKRAARSNDWSDFIFTAPRTTFFVGNAWRQPRTEIFYSRSRPRDYAGLSGRVYYSRTVGGVPSQSVEGRYTNIRLLIAGKRK